MANDDLIIGRVAMSRYQAAPRHAVPAGSCPSGGWRHSLVWELPRLLFPTPYAALIWLIILLNHAVLVFLRPIRCGVLAHVVGYSLLGLQLTAYISTLVTPPGCPPDHWTPDSAPFASAGRPGYTVDGRTGAKLPLRARIVHRKGVAVLAFDHFCFWLGVPIGLRNRKLFVLYICYSALLLAFALCIHLSDLYMFNSTLYWASPPGWGRARRLGSIGRLVEPVLSSVKLTFASLPPEVQTWLASCFVMTVIDLVAASILFSFAMFHLRMVLRNRTSLGVDEERFDLGRAANFRQVFGDRALLWLLPVVGSGPSVDGINWPENPRYLDDSDQELRASHQCELGHLNGRAQRFGDEFEGPGAAKKAD